MPVCWFSTIFLLCFILQSYDACVLGNYSECVDPMGTDPEEGYFKLIPFFCGQEDFCRSGSAWLTTQLIRNIFILSPSTHYIRRQKFNEEIEDIYAYK